MSDTTPYNIVQTVFMLAMAAGSASGVDDTQANLQSALAVALNGGTLPEGVPFVGFFPSTNSLLAGGDWSVVWGPAVFSPPPIPPATTGFAANAMYVAYSPSQATYVVAIAGTNFNSTYDLQQEDENVTATTMAQFPFDLPFVQTTHAVWGPNPPPAVSAGTAVGVSNLLTQMTDPSKGSLADFLSVAATTADTLVFCGHSLGGALAPTMALWLYPQSASTGWKQVLVLPLAGPTPGNTPFAQQFAAAFPATSSGVGGSYDNWNVDYVNYHDAVPYAWNNLGAVVSPKDARGKYPSIYGTMSKQVGEKVNSDLQNSETLASGGDYANLPQVQFFSTFAAPGWGMWNWTQNGEGGWNYPPVWGALPQYTDSHAISTQAEMDTLAQATHVDQYYNYFGVVPAPQMPLLAWPIS